ncbi:MAG TPA: helix-turn-helix domain-containing protein [Candidatus Sulfotelmatobacter sp.]|nr:helix-turn-helix domain-containing protein [Candidatus Sulfotelmatobacter sp.]
MLEAAEKVFIRDGYEGAQLAEIASFAGRSKGALYGHFKSKEDLFFSLVEHRVQIYAKHFALRTEKCTNEKEQITALCRSFEEAIQDKSFTILILEFKLYLLRHPQSDPRLFKALQMTRPTSKDWQSRLAVWPTATQRADFDLALAAIGSMLSGLILESHFDPERLSDRVLKKLTRRQFRLLFPASSVVTRS